MEFTDVVSLLDSFRSFFSTFLTAFAWPSYLIDKDACFSESNTTRPPPPPTASSSTSSSSTASSSSSSAAVFFTSAGFSTLAAHTKDLRIVRRASASNSANALGILAT